MYEAFQYQWTSLSKTPAAVIMGDFNYPDNYWDYKSAKSQRSNQLLSSIADNFICQKVEDRTRVSDILALILNNREEMVEEEKKTNILGIRNCIIFEFMLSR